MSNSATFLTDNSLENTDYYVKRNYAYDVQRYVLPMWSQCMEVAQRVNDRNLTLVHKQKELLDSYVAIFTESHSIWKSYANMFQEEQANILVRVTMEKTSAFIAAHRAHLRNLSHAMTIIGSNGEVSAFTWVYRVWNTFIILFMILLLFARSFPNHALSISIINVWNQIVFSIARAINRPTKSLATMSAIKWTASYEQTSAKDGEIQAQ